MVWQDTVITIIIILFGYALIPQIIQGYKTKKQDVSLQTSFIPFAGMYIMTPIYLTLDLTFSAITVFMTGTLWLAILLQKLKYK